MAYCSLSDLKLYMRGFDDADASDDTSLNRAISAAQAIIDRHTHRTFEASLDTTNTFDAVRDVGDGTLQGYRTPYTWKQAELFRTLWIDTDLAAITTVTNGDGTTIDSTKYILLPRRRSPIHAIQLKIDSNIIWTWVNSPEDAISITGKWAYSIVAPSDIVQAALRLAAWLYKQGENYNPGIDRPIISPSGEMILPMDFPRDVLSLLKPFRRL